MKKYDLIVIGAGVSGLSTAIAWLATKKGAVLVLEKEPVPGGCIASFRRQGYRFETVQLIPEMGDLLEWLGVYCTLVPYSGTLSRLFLARPGGMEKYTVPAGIREFQGYLTARWPEEKDAIGAFFSWSGAILEELSYLTIEPSIIDMIKIALKCPHIVKVSKDTWKQYLDRFSFKSPELVETLDLFSAFAGVSGDRCAALLTAVAMETSLTSSWRADPAFIRLPDAMRRRVAELGGEIRMNSRVAEILVREGKAQGVVTAAGEVIQADTVVSTIDTKVMLTSLLGEDKLRPVGGPWHRNLKSVKMSPSMIAVHLGLDDGIDLEVLGLDGAYNVLTTGRSAHEAAFEAWEKGTAVCPESTGPGGSAFDLPEAFHLAFYSPSLSNGDRAQTLVIHVAPVSGAPWIELRARDYDAYVRAKDAVAERYIRLLERHLIPGLSSHILLRDVATPATFARYLGSTDGACYDMMPTINQFGMNRMPLRGPFEGLFQTKFSHGIWAAMHAGMQVLDLVTKGAVMKRAVRYRPPKRVR